jgi:hypothetical protein
LLRKAEWAGKHEYQKRLTHQHDIQAAILDSLIGLIGNVLGQQEHESLMLKPYDEALKLTKQQLNEQATVDGIDKTEWWKN